MNKKQQGGSVIRRIYAFANKTSLGRFMSQTAVYGVGAAGMPLVSALLVPIYARVLTTAEFGELAIILIVQNFLGMIMGLSLCDAVVRMYYRYEGRDKESVLSTCLITVVASCILLSAVVWTSNRSFALAAVLGIRDNTLFCLVLLSSSWSVISVTILNGLRAQQRPRAYVALSICSLVAMALAKIFYVVVLRQGVLGAMKGAALGGAVAIAIGVVLISTGRYRWGSRFSTSALKGSLRFGLPLMPSSVFSWVLNGAPRYFLLWYVSEVAVGTLSLGMQLLSFTTMLLIDPITKSWQPMVYAIGNKARQQAAISEGLYGIVSLLSWALLAVIMFRKEIVELVLSDQHASVATVLPLLGIWILVKAALMPLGVAINIKSRTEAHSAGFFTGMIVLLGLCRVLAPGAGLQGVILAIVGGQMVILTFYAIVVWRIFPLPVALHILLAIVGLAALIWICSEAMLSFAGWMSLTLRIALLAIFPLLLYYLDLLGPLSVRLKPLLHTFHKAANRR